MPISLIETIEPDLTANNPGGKATYDLIDKSDWLDGPWKNEPDTALKTFGSHEH